MGNSTSDNNAESNEEEQSEPATPSGPVEATVAIDLRSIELELLLDPRKLREVAADIKEETVVSPLQQHHYALVRWLENGRLMEEEYITLTQFSQFFACRGVEHNIAKELCQQFDVEGDGVCDVDHLHEILSSGCISNIVAFRNDLPSVNKLLRECLLAPGFVDAFNDTGVNTSDHGHKIFKFLFRNQALSVALPLASIEGFITTTEMRLKVLNAYIGANSDISYDKVAEANLQPDEVIKHITNCITSLDVSTNRDHASKLSDEDSGTFWQSDGPARAHWIRLHIAPSTIIKQLSITVMATDQSYMPQHVVVSAGHDAAGLRDVANVKIPSHFTGDYTILEGMKIPYPIIQINIKRCHSDGCDTRIRQVKAVGFRVVKSKGISVMDASMAWYLSVLTSTAEAALPTAPHLRNVIMQHTRASLKHINPLALSSGSTERPKFLSCGVMAQMEHFLYSIARSGTQVEVDEISVLLEFSLARGSLGSVLDALSVLWLSDAEQYSLLPILQSVKIIKDKAQRLHGNKLRAKLFSCNGGAKDNSSGPENVLSANWETESYLSANGKKNVTMSFKLSSGNQLELTRFIMKAAKGPIGPSSGLVFVMQSNLSGNDFKAYLKKSLAKYDDWRIEDYERSRDSLRYKEDAEQSDPVGFFSLDNDWDDVDIFVDKICCGNIIAVKFLGSRLDSAERIGVCGIDLLGYEIDALHGKIQDNLSSHLPSTHHNGDIVSKSFVFYSLFDFIISMSRDMVHLKSISPKHVTSIDEDKIFDVHDVTLQQVWHLYSVIESSTPQSESEVNLCKCLVLDTLVLALPYLKPEAQRLQLTKNPLNSSPDADISTLSDTVFLALCDIVDQLSSSDIVYQMAKEVILKGAEVFFPHSEARRDHLLKLVKEILENNQRDSLSLTFESLCTFFSNKDAGGLLGLPNMLPKDGFNASDVVNVVETLVCVTHNECLMRIKGKEFSHSTKPSSLVQLVCALQKTLLTWCYSQCKDGPPVAKSIASHVLREYLSVVAHKSLTIFRFLLDSDDKLSLIDDLEQSFVSVALRPLILFLNLFAKLDVLPFDLLHTLKDICKVLFDISHHIPERLSHVTGCQWTAENTVVFKTWDVESVHCYESNSNIHMSFDSSECSMFRIEFDDRCTTERRYDYLEFTDSAGLKKKFDDKVGTDRWPKTIEFNAGKTLSFHFHSDGSDNQWGYKFKVSAMGTPDIAVLWLFDLQLSFAQLFGSFCSHAIDTSKAMDRLSPCNTRNSNNNNNNNNINISNAVNHDNETVDPANALLHSELWASLFRGGYLVGKLERSLSGFHGCSPSESNVNSFLLSVAKGSTGEGKDFVTRCNQSTSSTGFNLGGGEVVQSAVNSVFAALIWHTQELREQVMSLSSSSSVLSTDEPSSEIIAAYKKANSIRQSLLRRRQEVLVAVETCTAEGQEPPDPDSPAVSCREKALFLLKFAGLSKLGKSKRESTSPLERRSSALNRPKSWHRQESRDISGSRQAHWSGDSACQDKYPTFKLVIEFVMNTSLSHEKIQSLLHQRRNYANALANALSFASEYLQMQSTDEHFTAPVVLFLQQMLSCQRRFPNHYADYLNGCGLELETRVRRTYYRFIRLLMDIELKASADQTSECGTSLTDCARIFLLHLLTIAWKPYDHPFLAEIGLPEFLLRTANNTSLYPKARSLELEMEIYESHLKYLKEAKSTGINSWCQTNRKNATTDHQRFINLFIARFSDQLDVTITCNGCQALLKHRRYRCLNCIDTDLCSVCYSSGVVPTGHTEDHQVIDLRFKCDVCSAFIVGTRIHCNTCKDFDLCFGCYQDFMKPSKTVTSNLRHQRHHSIAKFPFDLDVQATMTSGFNLHSYTHHYSWLQFSSLALNMSTMLQNRKIEESDYIKVTSGLLIDCMRGLTKSFAVNALLTSTPSADVPSAVDTDDSRTLLVSHDSSASIVRSSDQTQDESDSESPSGEAIENGYMESNSDINDKSNDSSTDDLTNSSSSKLNCNGTATSSIKSSVLLSQDDRSDVAQERILGLLAAILPQGRQMTYLPCAEELMTIIVDELFPALLTMLIGPCNNEYILCITLGTLNKTLKCIGPEIADKGAAGMDSVRSNDALDCNGTVDVTAGGYSAIQFLYNFGAQCIRSCRLNCVAGVINIIHDLLQCHRWHDAVYNFINRTIADVSSLKPSYYDLFSVAVVAGFPELGYVGRRAHFSNDAAKQVVVLQTLPDQSLLVVVNLITRKQSMVKERCLEFPSSKTSVSCLDSNHGELFINMLKTISGIARHNQLQEEANVPHNWLSCGLVPCVVSLACRGTGMSRQWMLRDLEFLGWLMYPSDAEDSPSLSMVTSPEQDNNVPSTSNSMNPFHTSQESSSKTADPLEGLEPETQQCMRAIHEAVGCSFALIRAIYEMNNQDGIELVKEVQSRYQDGEFHVSEEIRSLSAKWEENVTDKEMIGNAVSSLSTVDIGFDMRPTSDRIPLDNLTAKPESEENHRKFIATVSEIEVNETKQWLRILKSSHLFSQEIYKKNRKNANQFTKQVHTAVAIGYSRRLLCNLFANWPQDRQLSHEALHGIDAAKIVGLLDLLQELDECKDQFDKVVFSFVRSCDPELLHPLAISAVQCMGEIQLASEVRESGHNYKAGSTVESKVYIPGATSLFVTFDSRCVIELLSDELTLSSSSDLLQSKHTYSGANNWHDVEIPGDTLHYKFVSTSSSSDWGWKFTVTGGQMGRFETGCFLLRALFAQNLQFARLLPLCHLWAWLVVVACNQVGQQRLMATGLLLRILQIAVGDPFLFGDVSIEPLTDKLRPDLKLLKPLWTLYTKTMENDAGTSFSLVSPVTRGLSELFLVVENVAQEWGMAEELLAGFTNDAKLASCFCKAIRDIAAISLAVDLETKAIDLLKTMPAQVLPDPKVNENSSQSSRTNFRFEDLRSSPLVRSALHEEMNAFLHRDNLIQSLSSLGFHAPTLDFSLDGGDGREILSGGSELTTDESVSSFDENTADFMDLGSSDDDDDDDDSSLYTEDEESKTDETSDTASDTHINSSIVDLNSININESNSRTSNNDETAL